MFVDVVAVLIVAVTVVDVIDVVVVDDFLAAVILGMGRAVVVVKPRLRMAFPVVDVVDVVAVHHGLVSVAGQMLVIAGLGVLICGHECSLTGRRIAGLPFTTDRRLRA